MREILLGEARDEGQAVERFWRLARAYVLGLGADDSFRVEGRVRGEDVRRIAWSPGEGPAVLGGYLRDYQEYFEGITFPAVDPQTGLPAGTVRGRGVGLAVLWVEGPPALVEAVERLASSPEVTCWEQLPPGPRARRMRMYEATWRSRRDGVEAIREGLEDPDEGVVATALRLVGRYRLGELRQEATRLVADPRPAVRDAGFHGLQSILAGLPWVERRDHVSASAGLLGRALPYLSPSHRLELLGWLTAAPAADAVAALVAAIEDPDEAVAVAAVEALGREGARAVLQTSPELMADLLRRLERVGNMRGPGGV